MNKQEREAFEALRDALQTCQAELVILRSRLTEPYRGSVGAAAEIARTALAKADALEVEK